MIPDGDTGPTALGERPPEKAGGEERAWSALAHLTAWANLFTGFLGTLAALVLWLAFRRRSREVAFHALQAFWYQLLWLAALGAGWAVTLLLTLVLVGFLLMPLMAVLTLVPCAHAAYAAWRVAGGHTFRYPLVGGLLDRGRGGA
jgi:uncharacterized Tic20 family protein